jgi:uncharacterized protein (DUF58 family)
VTSPEDLGREVRRLELTTRHLVRDVLAGAYLSVFRGRGVEFSEVREYAPGDDVRSIDWNVTARLGAPHVKRYVEERALTVMFIVDVSASAGFGSRVRTKGDLAAELCAVLALAAARNSDRVGALLFTDRVESLVPPRQGRRQARRVISELLACAPAGRGTDLPAALDALRPALRHRCVLFLVSDFWRPGRELDLALARAARQHDVIAVQVHDARERELPRAGLVPMWDPEAGDWSVVDSESAAVRDHFAARMAAFDEETRERFRTAGVDSLRLETGRDYAEPLLGFFRARERRLWR